MAFNIYHHLNEIPLLFYKRVSGPTVIEIIATCRSGFHYILSKTIRNNINKYLSTTDYTIHIGKKMAILVEIILLVYCYSQTVHSTIDRATIFFIMTNYFGITLRGNFFLCHVFSTKSVQNLKSFWRTSQIRFICALLCSLLTELHF